LPSIAIYGANAAGKSNLFKALTSAILFVRNSSNMQVNTRIAIPPFLLDENSRNNKRRFDFIFVNNGIKYEYGFTVDEFRVYEEYLYEYKSAKASMIFERFDTNKYKYTSNLKRPLKQYEEKNIDNKLFLATATSWNCKETKNAFLWFTDCIDTYNVESLHNAMVEELEAGETDGAKSFFIDFVRKADFNISGYDFQIKPTDIFNVQLPSGLLLEDNIQNLNMKEWKLNMSHEIIENNNKVEYSLPYYEESNGTRLFFSYAPAIYRALKKGKTIVIDEIDNGLHPLLVQHIVDIFNNPDINTNGAQLIFNTHDVTLLDLELLRRDQIYFVEKDNKTAASEMYSLSDFSPRTTEKIGKRYLQGRYGAVPNINIFG
jgi:hypothetical protein